MGESKLEITSEMWDKAWEPTDTSTGNGAGPQSDGKKALTLKRTEQGRDRVPAFAFSSLRKLLIKNNTDAVK